jgi:F-type H+-transporting ATPase subunit a
MSTPRLEPLHQFMVKPLAALKMGGLDLTVTNSSIFMLATLILLAGFFAFAFGRSQKIPSLVQSLAELPLGFARQMIQDSNGQEGMPFLSLISSIFLFVLVGNVLGLLPFAFTFTSQIIVNFSLAFLVVSVITLYGFVRHGLGFLRLFCPKGVPWWVAPILVPIELISYLSRPLSLAIRLFANMVAGHSMLKIFAYFTLVLGGLGVLPLMVNVALLAFELMVAFLQAYVFAMLCCIYLNDALHLH